MTVKIYNVNNAIECFESNSFVTSKVKEFNPYIIKVEVFAEGKKIASRGHLFPWWYKNVTFKSHKIQKIVEQMEQQKVSSNA